MIHAAPASFGSPGLTPDVELHLVMDNYTTHKHAKVKAWLAANPRVTVHVTPDLQLLAEPGRGLVRHHRTPSHPPRSAPVRRDLMIKTRAFIDGWNRRKHPFIWTKTPDEILAKIYRKRNRTSSASHWLDRWPITIPRSSGPFPSGLIGRPRRLAPGCGWAVVLDRWSGPQFGVFVAAVAVASVVPVSPLVSMARRVSHVNRGLLP